MIDKVNQITYYSNMNRQIKLSIDSLKDTKIIAMMAILLALHILVSTFFIPVFDNTRIHFTFFINALVGVIGGPLWALIFGFASDVLGFMIHPVGAYFPGYTLTSMVGALIYAVMLYKRKISVTNLILTKTVVNLGCNVALNSLWSYLLYSKGYLYYLIQGLTKNLILLPFEIILLVLLFRLLLPTLNKLKYTNQEKIPII